MFKTAKKRWTKVNIPGIISQDFVIIANASVQQDRLDHWKYVHDVTLFKLPCILQQTLNGLDIWVEDHKMKLNQKK